MTVRRYRKKPVVIEAWQLTPENVEDVAAWCGGRVVKLVKPGDPTDVYIGLDIPTLEGVMRGDTFHSSTYRNGEYHGGDFIVKGPFGEFYPVKPDIFWETYDDC